MTLPEKILALYPELTMEDFLPTTGTIRLQNDSDGKGDYIKEWNHPTETQPTQEELDSMTTVEQLKAATLPDVGV